MTREGGWHDGLWIQRKLSFYVDPPLIHSVTLNRYSNSLHFNIFMYENKNIPHGTCENENQILHVKSIESCV